MKTDHLSKIANPLTRKWRSAFIIIIFSSFAYYSTGQKCSVGVSEPLTPSETIEHENFVSDFNENRGNRSLDKYIIPVVVHIIHNYGPENISDADVTNAINLLNNQYAGNYGGFNCDIEFRLAKTDPDGNCTTGITRTQFSTPQIRDPSAPPMADWVYYSTIRNLIKWPKEKYLNIWIVRNIYGYVDYSVGPDQFQNVGYLVHRPIANPIPEIADTFPTTPSDQMRHSLGYLLRVLLPMLLVFT